MSIPFNYAELEQPYKTAMEGSGGPDVGILFCPDCKRSFVLFRGDPDNEVCEHIMDWFNKHTARRENHPTISR